MNKLKLVKWLTILKLIFFLFIIKRIDRFFNYKYIQNNFLTEKNAYFKYLNLENKLFQNNISLIKKEKESIINWLFYDKSNNITSIKKIFYTSDFRFGNILVNLNKLINYCQIIGCKLIVLDKKAFWFIKKKIIIPPMNISIDIGDYNESLYFFDKSVALFYSSFIFKPDIRINFLRKEIISNLPKIKTSKDNLYIHIRSGDIFTSSTNINIFYSQPPLCFYHTIIDNYNFSKIYLISIDKLNPVIQKLISHYPSIINTKNSLELDISLLINAYNIVASISSFLNLIIQLNYNLKFLWDYNIYKTSEKVLLLHYDLYKYPHNKFTIFRMEPSFKYRTLMYIWKNNFIQKRLMIKEKCNNYFILINKEI